MYLILAAGARQNEQTTAATLTGDILVPGLLAKIALGCHIVRSCDGLAQVLIVVAHL